MLKWNKLRSEENFSKQEKFAKVNTGFSVAGIIERIGLHPRHPTSCVQQEARLCLQRLLLTLELITLYAAADTE